MTSCAASPPPLEIRTIPQPISRPAFGRPAPVSPPDVRLRIATPDRPPEGPLYGFTESDYLAFAVWLEDILRHIKEQRATITAYEKWVARD